MVKRIVSMLIMLLLIGCLTLTAFATHPVPDLSQNGSITFVMDLDGELLDGGKLNLYKIGDIAEDDGNYSFALIDALDGSDLTLEDVSNPILAEELLTIAKVLDKETGLEKYVAPIEEGAAVFADLPNGLYVVFQNDEDVTKGFAAIQPFLISVPKFQNGAYELDVIAKPKVPLETAPPETTTPPTPDEQLPQTGQLNWPVPVLAFSGALLLILGFVLRTAGKKERADA